MSRTYIYLHVQKAENIMMCKKDMVIANVLLIRIKILIVNETSGAPGVESVRKGHSAADIRYHYDI